MKRMLTAAALALATLTGAAQAEAPQGAAAPAPTLTYVFSIRAVAERHGGTLTLHAGPGGSGLAVSLRLPLAHDRLNTGFP